MNNFWKWWEKLKICFRQRRAGFTLVEILIAAGVLLLVLGGSVVIYTTSLWIWKSTSTGVEASQEANKILDKIVYGVGTNTGIRAAVASTVNISILGSNVMLGYAAPDGESNVFIYNSPAQSILYSSGGTNSPVVIGTNVTAFSAVNMTNGTTLQIRVVKREGRFVSTNDVNTFVKFRN